MAVLVLSLVAAGVMLLDPPAEQPEVKYDKTPILFVHGHGLSPKYWDRMIARFAEAGYPQEYLLAVDIRPRRMSNISAAENFIAPAVDKLLSDARAASSAAGFGATLQRVDIIAHSMGAISSRWYAARIAPQKVRTWIAIAGTNSGTDAMCEHHDDGARELCPAYAKSVAESKIQVELNGVPEVPKDATPYGVGADSPDVVSVRDSATRYILFLTVRAPDDEWIVPPGSAEIDGAGGIDVMLPKGLAVSETSPGNFLLEEASDHDMLPRNPVVIETVAAMLAARDEAG
jgi:pimeloyl-ACP methyl ester carboxylesterase